MKPICVIALCVMSHQAEKSCANVLNKRKEKNPRNLLWGVRKIWTIKNFSWKRSFKNMARTYIFL